MPRRRQGKPIAIPGWVTGLIENVGADIANPGAISEGLNIVPRPGNKIAVRGGSRIMSTFVEIPPTPLGYDTFTDTAGTDITSHTPDSGWTAWTGFTGIMKIDDDVYSGTAVRAATALNRHVNSNVDVTTNGTAFVITALVTRSNEDDASAGLGIVFRTNGVAVGAGEECIMVEFAGLGAGTPDTLFVRTLQRLNGSTGETNTIDATMSWTKATTKRLIITVDGSDVQLSYEDEDGQNRHDYTAVTLTTDYDDASHEKIGIYTDVSLVETEAYWYVHDYYVYTKGDESPVYVTDVLAVKPFSVTGAVVVANTTTNNKHYAYLTDGALNSNGTKVDLSSWWGTGEARPVIVELFENLYLCDANPTYSSRFPMLKLTGGAVASVVNFNFGAGAANLKPYTMEEFGGCLFIAGYDDNNVEDNSLLRHSKLLTEPAATGGFDSDAWAIIGARGKAVTAMKKGKGVMLVAKADALYRVFGEPQANPGWQFAIDELDFGEGYGCTNAYTLAFFNGWWYGIGESGPWRTDGTSIENLADRRRDSWDNTDMDLAYAWVESHPQREVVLFGIPGSSYPTTVWVWDIKREQWFGDWEFSFGARMGAPVISSEFIGTGSIPTGVTISGETETSFTVSWTNADGTASTEVWVRERGDDGNGTDGNWSLYDTVAPAVTSRVVGNRDGYTHYEVKLRHTKGGVPGSFTAVEDAYTDIIAPDWQSGGARGVSDTSLKVKLDVIVTSDGADIKFQRRSVNSSCGSPGSWADVQLGAGGISEDTTDLAIGGYTMYDRSATCNNWYQYQIRMEDAGWPGPGKNSSYVLQTNGPTCSHACNNQ